MPAESAISVAIALVNSAASASGRRRRSARCLQATACTIRSARTAPALNHASRPIPTTRKYQPEWAPSWIAVVAELAAAPLSPNSRAAPLKPAGWAGDVLEIHPGLPRVLVTTAQRRPVTRQSGCRSGGPS